MSGFVLTIYHVSLELYDLQFTIELRLEVVLALDCAADHGHNDELGASLPADGHGRVDVDADCEGRLEGGET